MGLARYHQREGGYSYRLRRVQHHHEAARCAGYSVNTAYSQGQRLLTNADIAAGIQVRIAQMTMSADVRKCQV